MSDLPRGGERRGVSKADRHARHARQARKRHSRRQRDLVRGVSWPVARRQRLLTDTVTVKVTVRAEQQQASSTAHQDGEVDSEVDLPVLDEVAEADLVVLGRLHVIDHALELRRELGAALELQACEATNAL